MFNMLSYLYINTFKYKWLETNCIKCLSSNQSCGFMYIEIHVEHDVTKVSRGISFKLVRLTKCDIPIYLTIYLVLLGFGWRIRICEDADDDASCPHNSACEDVNEDTEFECKSEEGFDEVDVPGLTRDGHAATVCVGMKYLTNIRKC